MFRLRRILGLLMSLLSGHAFACSCIAPVGTSEQFQRHALVAVVEVVANERQGVQFQARYVFKGSAVGGQRISSTLARGTDCEVRAKVGQLWLVYADDSNSIALSRCSPSGPLAERIRELKQLFALADADSSAGR